MTQGPSPTRLREIAYILRQHRKREEYTQPDEGPVAELRAWADDLETTGAPDPPSLGVQGLLLAQALGDLLIALGTVESTPLTGPELLLAAESATAAVGQVERTATRDDVAKAVAYVTMYGAIDRFGDWPVPELRRFTEDVADALLARYEMKVR